MTLGREVRLPAKLIFGSVSDPAQAHVTNYGDYVNGIMERLNQAHSVARSPRAKGAVPFTTGRCYSIIMMWVMLYGASLKPVRLGSRQNWYPHMRALA